MDRIDQSSGLFFGRDDALGRLESLFETRPALVTLVGPPGVGKTRLALEYGRRARADGVATHFVDLTRARDTEDILLSTATALDFETAPKTSEAFADAVGNLLARRRCILILDNLEGIRDAARELIATWMARAPECGVLATSRVPLDSSSEVLLRLPPLETDVAVALFDARVARLGQEFPAETYEDRAALAQALDGLPLAIELAAARAQIFTPSMLLKRMRDRFEILKPRSPDSTRSLWQAIELSWQLLDPHARELLARASCLEHPFDLAAAQNVLGADDAEVWETLETLVSHSLIDATPGSDGEMSFRLLESVRDFCHAIGASSQHEQDVRRRHAHHYGELARSVRRELTGPQGLHWRRLLQHHVAAFLCVADRYEDFPEQAAACLLALHRFHLLAPLSPEAYLQRLDAVSQVLDANDVLAELQLTKAELAMVSAWDSEAREALARLEALLDADHALWADYLRVRASLLIWRGENEGVLELLDEALAHARDRQNHFLTGWLENVRTKRRFDAGAEPAEIIEEHRATLAHLRRWSNLYFSELVATNLAAAMIRAGDPGALDVIHEALTNHRQTGRVLGIAATLAMLARYHAAEGDHALRNRYYREALETMRRRPDLERYIKKLEENCHEGEPAVACDEPAEDFTGHRDVLRIFGRGRSFQLADAEAVDLGRRKALPELLFFLARRRLAKPGVGSDVFELFEAGWPQEQASPETAAGRVYTAIYELRRCGLDEVVRKNPDGYLIDENIIVTIT